MALQFTTSYIEDSLTLFRYYKKLAAAAMGQVGDEQLTEVLDGEMNSIAQIVKHMAGNMKSRWTDFLTSDGEKPDRNRDTEFEEPPSSREALLELWEQGWNYLFSRSRTVGGCRPDAHHHDSRRTSFGDAGHQPAGGALFLSLRADCIPGQAFQGSRLDLAQRAARAVRRVQ